MDDDLIKIYNDLFASDDDDDDIAGAQPAPRKQRNRLNHANKFRAWRNNYKRLAYGFGESLPNLESDVIAKEKKYSVNSNGEVINKNDDSSDDSDSDMEQASTPTGTQCQKQSEDNDLWETDLERAILKQRAERFGRRALGGTVDEHFPIPATYEELFSSMPKYIAKTGPEKQNRTEKQQKSIGEHLKPLSVQQKLPSVAEAARPVEIEGTVPQNIQPQHLEQQQTQITTNVLKPRILFVRRRPSL